MSFPIEETLLHSADQTDDCKECLHSGTSHLHGDRITHHRHQSRALIIMCAGNVQNIEPANVPNASGSRLPLANASATLEAHSSEGSSGGQKLQHVYEDGHNLRAMLSDHYHFEDIRVLADDGKHESPTYENIERSIHKFCKSIEPGDNLVFAFIGHGGQLREKDEGSEKDGRDEYILAACGRAIIDNDLHEWLVVPLQEIHCKLTAIFDSCHSGTALDLDRPNPKKHLQTGFPPGDTTHSHGRHTRRLFHLPASFKFHALESRARGSHLYHAMHNVKQHLSHKHKIFSLSACRDDQRAYEFKKGYSLTDFIVKIVKKRGADLTLLTLQILLDDLNSNFLAVHEKLEEFRKSQATGSRSQRNFQAIYPTETQAPQVWSEQDVEVDYTEPFIHMRK